LSTAESRRLLVARKFLRTMAGVWLAGSLRLVPVNRGVGRSPCPPLVRQGSADNQAAEQNQSAGHQVDGDWQTCDSELGPTVLFIQYSHRGKSKLKYDSLGGT